MATLLFTPRTTIDANVFQFRLDGSHFHAEWNVWTGAYEFEIEEEEIDELEEIRSGKIMEYNKETGKRVKDQDGKAHINWIHKQPYNLKQCLFGLHITKDDKN